MQFSLYKSIVAIALIAVYTSNAHAEIYTCKDAKGDTVYTDSPSSCSNAEEIKTDKLPALVPSKSLTTRSNTSSTGVKKAEDENSYSELIITSPSNDATIRDNQGNLTINFRVAPGLETRKGHKYVVTVNGKEVYSGTSTITALKNVDRGTQTIGVKVVDQSGSTKISAAPVNVTVSRFSALQNQENTFNDGDSDSDNNPDNNDGDDEADRNNSFSFPTNSKFPTRPPPPPPAN